MQNQITRALAKVKTRKSEPPNESFLHSFGTHKIIMTSNAQGLYTMTFNL